MKTIVLYNRQLSPYIVYYNFDLYISGKKLKNYIRTVYQFKQKNILLVRKGIIVHDTDNITFSCEISWITY